MYRDMVHVKHVYAPEILTQKVYIVLNIEIAIHYENMPIQIY